MSRVNIILENVAKSGRVASAYLFLGPPGARMRESAEKFARDLGCAKQDKFVLSPSGASLKIDQVRELRTMVRYGPGAGPYLAVIVEKADTLTDQAAAAFLKTLEEPAAGVVFVLLAQREDRIPDTIVSRCQRVVFAEPLEEWAPDPEMKKLCCEAAAAPQKSTVELFKFSAALEKEKERIDDVLYELARFFRHQVRDAGRARTVLDTLRFIKRRANLRLALDVMSLRLSRGGEKANVN